MKAVSFFSAVFFMAFAAPATANGYGEDAPWQFRTPAEKQVLLNQEQLRLQFQQTDRGVGSQYGIQQTGNATNITVHGDGNSINVDQTNDGSQSAQHTEDGSHSSAFNPSCLNC
jgi:hypothetical protein